MPLDVSQKKVLDNLSVFLSKGKHRDKELVGQFLRKGRGYCNGISSLWLYTKGLQRAQTKAFEAISQLRSYDPPGLGRRFLQWLRPSPPPTHRQSELRSQDDYDWFKSTVELIASWDGVRELNAQETENFERFVSLIQFFHHTSDYLSVARGDLDVIQGMGLQKEYAIGSLFTLEQLKQLLIAENIIPDGRLVHVEYGLGRHITAIFRDGDNYYYFNPDSPEGEIMVKNLAEVATDIFLANAKYVASYDVSKPLPLSIRVFSYGEEVKKGYPPPQMVLERIRPLVEQIDGYAEKSSSLIMAVEAGSLESVQFFLRSGADPSAQNLVNQNAIIIAAEYGRLEILHALLSQALPSGRIDAMTVEGKSALMYAAMNGHKEAVELLLKSGATIDKTAMYSSSKKTALIWAARNGHKDIMELLIRYGANPAENRNDSYNETALMYAAKNGHLAIVERLLQFPAVRAEINIQSGLYSEDLQDEYETRGYIGIDNTPLMWAARNGYSEIVKMLFAHGARLDVVNLRGDNALMLAAKNGHSEVVKFLVEQNVDIDACNREGKNAYALAEEKGHKNVCGFLEQRRMTEPQVGLPEFGNLK